MYGKSGELLFELGGARFRCQTRIERVDEEAKKGKEVGGSLLRDRGKDSPLLLLLDLASAAPHVFS